MNMFIFFWPQHASLRTIWGNEDLVSLKNKCVITISTVIDERRKDP